MGKYQKKIEELETELANECGRHEVTKRDLDKALIAQVTAEKELTEHRWQLARIREAHTPLYEALYPGLLKGKFGGSVLPASADAIYEWTWNG